MSHLLLFCRHFSFAAPWELRAPSHDPRGGEGDEEERHGGAWAALVWGLARAPPACHSAEGSGEASLAPVGSSLAAPPATGGQRVPG